MYTIRTIYSHMKCYSTSRESVLVLVLLVLVVQILVLLGEVLAIIFALKAGSEPFDDQFEIFRVRQNHK